MREHFTPAEYKFLKKSYQFLNQALRLGKDYGKIPLGTTLRLVVDDEADSAYTQLLREGKTPVYVVVIKRCHLGDWRVMIHESGHVVLGHPTRGTASSVLHDRGDFVRYARRELEADHISLLATNQMDKLTHEISCIAQTLIEDFGLLPSDALKVMKQVARELHIPYRYSSGLRTTD